MANLSSRVAVLCAGLIVVGLILLHKRINDPMLGYASNEDVRSLFDQIDVEDVTRVTLNGFPLADGESKDVIAALRLSQRRISAREGQLYQADDHEGGFVEVSFCHAFKGSRRLVTEFSVQDPARHHGPLFAQAIQAALTRTDYAHQVEDMKRRGAWGNASPAR